MLIKKAALKPATDAELQIGSVVRSLGGRDRKRVFVVTGTNPVTVADGQRRTLENQKRKNPKHLTLLGVLGESERKKLEENPTNGEIRRMCAFFDDFLPQTQK